MHGPVLPILAALVETLPRGLAKARGIQAVWKEVMRGFVTLEKAHKSCGVVLDGDALAVDEWATHELRGELRSRRGDKPPTLDLGTPRSREKARLSIDSRDG